MKFGVSTRRSIRYSFFVGVLAGSFFLGSKTIAKAEPLLLSGITPGDDGGITLVEGATYDAGYPSGSTYFGNFNAIFNGMNATISGLLVPLFDRIGDGGEVKNLNLGSTEAPVNVSGNGALANYLDAGGRVENVTVTGDVSGGDVVGGLVGVSQGDIANSTVTGDVTVTGTSTVGGLVGQLLGGTITSSTVTGDVTVTGPGPGPVGGLVGDQITGSTITSSTVTGNVTVTGTDSDGHVGGLVGYSQGDVTSSTVTGNVTVTGTSRVGGLVGSSSFNTITDSHVTNGVSVTGETEVGGLIGSAWGGDFVVTQSTVTGVVTITGETNVGGLIGVSEDLIGVSEGLIQESNVTGAVTIAGHDNVGGLVGNNSGYISGSAVGEDVTVTGSGEYIGGLVGSSYGTIVSSNAHAAVIGTGTTDDDYGTGGLVGYLGGLLINSSATGTVTGFNEVGGLVGATGLAAAIQNSHATGDVSGNNQVGGLVGNLDPSHVVTNSSASGDVTGRWDVGGLVGYSSGDITLSYATGAVSGEDRVGGLVGYSSGDIAFSSAKGEVTSTAVNAVDDGVHGELAPGGANGIGGLVGYNTGNITSSFTGEADTDLPIPSGAVTGLKNVGGLVGFSSGNITNSRATGDVNQSWSCIMGEAYAPCFEYIGGLVGKSEGDITNSWASGNVGGQDYVGGLVGQLDGDVTNSYAAGYVSGDRYVGGLVGRSTGVITNGETYADKSLELDYVSGSEFVGGLVGYSEGNVIDSVSRVPVSGGRYVGGLVGKSEGNVTNSVAEGEVRGESSEVGGLVGYSVGDITNSSATGDVTGAGIAGPTDYIGGLVGYLEGVIKNSFATGSVTGRDNVGGLVGSLFQGLPWSNEYSDLSTLRSSRPTPNIGEINLVQGDFYTWDGDDWRKIFSISGSYASGNVIGQDYIGGLVGRAGESTTIDSSFARGNVSGDDEVGGLIGLLNDGASVTHSYATGDVIGNDDVGGLVGLLNDGASVTHSYATGDVTGNLTEGDGGDVGGLVGIVYGIISNSHATGDVSGIYDVGGLVGDLNSDGVIRNSYATGNVTATGFDGDWTNGWGGLVGEFSGIIENSYATGNVLADYHAGSLVGFILYDSGATINNSFATGVVSRGSRSVAFSPEERCIESCDTYEPVQVPVNFVEWNSAFGGFVGCQSSETNGDSVINVSCSVDELTQSTPAAPPILSVVNTAGTAGAPAFEIIACKNNGLPLLSELSASYANTCVAPVTTNRERRIREFIQTTSMTEIAKTLGFVVSPKFPNDASIAFIKSEKELVISKILGLQIAADRVARTFVKTGEALQISYEYEGKDPIELWVKLANGQWLLAGVITFDKDGKAILPPLQFKSAGDYSLVLSKPSADSAKGSALLNQTGSLLVAVS